MTAAKLKIKKGDQVVVITGRYKGAKGEVLQVIPSQFRISFDKRSTKRVEVHARVIGATAPGFRIDEVDVDPQYVTITGPEKRVNSIDGVITDPVDASGVMGHATFITHVYVSDPLVRLASPSAVHVVVDTHARNRGQ